MLLLNVMSAKNDGGTGREGWRRGLVVHEGGKKKGGEENPKIADSFFFPPTVAVSSQETASQNQKDSPDMGLLLIRGKFSQLRDAVGKRGEDSEVRFMLSALEHLHFTYRNTPASALPADENSFARVFFASEGGSIDYYSTLFAILREAGFTAKDKADIRKSFAATKQKPSVSPFDDERRDKTFINATLALDSTFSE